MSNPITLSSTPHHIVPQAVAISLGQSLNRVRHHPYDNHLKNAAVSGKILRQNLPSNMQSVLGDISRHKSPFMLISGMPIHDNLDNLVQTPRILSRRPDKGNHISESLLLGLSNLLGSAPRVARDNESGEITQEALSQIAPVDKKSDLGAGSKIAYKMHTEAAGAVNPPDFFGLLALRGDKNAKTVYMTTDEIVKNLDDKTIDDLRRKEFRFNPKKGKGDYVGSVLRKNKHDRYEVRLNLASGRTDALTDRAKTALDKLDNFVSNHPNVPSITLKQGDLAVFDNRSLLHGRDAFEISTPHGQERWLQRGYFGSTTENFDVNTDAFLDKKGRTCHDILPRQKIYKNIQDFCKNATPQEKIQILNRATELASGAKGYRFVMDSDPKTKNLRMYVATTQNMNDADIRDSRWEKRGVLHNGKPTTIINNPLYQKAQDNLKTTKSASENFVSFGSLKPNHDLIVPKQKNFYRDLNEFVMAASNAEKTELFDMIAKNIKHDGAVYVNCGVSRHIPWLHVHVVDGQKNIEKLATVER